VGAYLYSFSHSLVVSESGAEKSSQTDGENRF